MINYIYLFAYIYTTIRVHHRGRSIYHHCHARPISPSSQPPPASYGGAVGGAGMEGPLEKRKPR